MRKNILLLLALLVISTSVSAQFYASLSGGYHLGVNKEQIGVKRSTRLNATFTDFTTSGVPTVGSYGEGVQGQLRLGYFFNETIGLELGLGYLNGVDNTNNQVVYTNRLVSPNTESNLVDMYARARAFGASLSAVVNVSKNVYLRVGALTKVGGKTESITNLDFSELSSVTGADIQADFQTDFKGKMPLGFVGGIGYKYFISDKINLFAEVEYLNIKVYRKSSSLTDYSGTLNGVDLSSGDLAATLSSSVCQASFCRDVPIWIKYNQLESPPQRIRLILS